jgi:serine protease Do
VHRFGALLIFAHELRGVGCTPVGSAIGGVAVLLVGLLAAGCAGLGPSAQNGRQEIIDRIVASSVKVSIEQDGRRVASGSGVVIASTPVGPDRDPRTFVLTAAHVLGGWEGARLFVRCAGAQAGSGKYPATLKYRAPSGSPDLALLEVLGVSLPAARYVAEEEVRLGEEILIVGYPWGKRLGLFSGIVSQIPTKAGEDGTAGEGADPTLVVDASSSKGVSGGGVFRAATGMLVGIVEGYQTASIAVKDRSQTYSVKIPMPGETFVVPLVRIREFLAGVDLTVASRTPEDGRVPSPR